jgi:hypothetical protein
VRDFLYAVCNNLAARDAVRLFQLRIGAEIVASRIGFAVGDSIYLYYSGFDPAWGRYSVMTTTSSAVSERLTVLKPFAIAYLSASHIAARNSTLERSFPKSDCEAGHAVQICGS